MGFEDSNCFEYVVEKYWKTFGQTVVPVVRGSANYKKIAPEHSYIDADDFGSFESLGKLELEVSTAVSITGPIFVASTDLVRKSYNFAIF